MNPIHQGINNVFKLKWNASTGVRGTTAAVILTGAVAIGVLAILSSSGMPGLMIGGGLCGLAGTPLLLDVAWMTALVKNQLNSDRELKEEELEEPQELIAKTFDPPTNKGSVSAWFTFHADKPINKLIAAAHSINDRELLAECIDEAGRRGNSFLHTLFQCRDARLELDEQGFFPFDFENEIVVPVCETGMERSASVYGILRLMYPNLRIQAPYGVKGGIDPYNRQEWINQTQKTHTPEFSNTFKKHFGFSPPNPLGTHIAKNIGFDFNSGEWKSIADILKNENQNYFEKQRIEQNQYTQKQTALGKWFSECAFKQAGDEKLVWIPVNQSSKELLSERIQEAGNILHIELGGTFPLNIEDTIFHIQSFLRQKVDTKNKLPQS